MHARHSPPRDHLEREAQPNCPALRASSIRRKLELVPVVGVRPAEADQVADRPYTVSDGDLVLTLEPAEEGGYVVTSPFDPELITEAETIEEAFENARDAADAPSR